MLDNLIVTEMVAISVTLTIYNTNDHVQK